MENFKAIPDGYFTVGELAKKVGVTVRTLQYYDKQGLLKPAILSEGGRRLYTYQEVVNLQQILSLKYLGYTLNEIKQHLNSVKSTGDAITIMENQAQSLEDCIQSMTTTLKSLNRLIEEVKQTNEVDWKKYADIMILLRDNDPNVHLLRKMPKKAYEKIRHMDTKKADDLRANFNEIIDKFGELQKNNIPSNNEKALLLAKKFWDLVMDFTGGDLTLMKELEVLGEGGNQDWQKKMDYLEQAVDIYIKGIG